MISDSVLAKVGMIALGTMTEEEIEKQAANTKALRSGLRRALKIVGLSTGGGAAIAGAHQVGKSSGRASGIEQGKKSQFEEDKETFKQVAPRIFRAGRLTQARQDEAAFKSYLSRNVSGTAGNSNNYYSNMESGSSHTKTAMSVAHDVINGWKRGDIKTSSLRSLPQHEMEKVATALVQQMDNGDQLAGILWRTLYTY